MNFKKPKDTKEIVWTRHAISKMKFYGLTANRLRKILRNPTRQEEGIVPGTIAIMQEVGGKKKTEIWLMYQKTKDGRKKIITAWRYPGKSLIRQVPVPKEILDELKI
jgi:hypothetical protein